MKTYWFLIGITIALAVVIPSCKKDIKDDGIIETQPPVLKANAVTINDAIDGFYSAVPEHYHETTTRYPLIIFLHGLGQVGNGTTGLPSLTYGGIPKLLHEGQFPPSFEVNGKHFSFVILAPQFKRWPGIEKVASFLDYAKENYRIDTTRIYLAGLSWGGILTTDFAAAYPSTLAAIVPIAGVSNGANVHPACEKIAQDHLPVWVFQNSEDALFNVEQSKNFIAVLKSYHPAIAPKYTQFLPFGLEGHDAWTKATDPAYKENNMNIYEWMLRYSR